MKTYTYSGDEVYNSQLLPSAYFNTALVLTDYIKKNIPKYGSNYQFKKIYKDPIYEMFNPLIYNLKHGIELSCKTFLNLGNNQFENEHDLQKIYEEFKEMCFTLICNGSIHLKEEEIQELTEIELLITNIYNGDTKNIDHRYPNTKSFLIQRVSKQTRKEINMDGKDQIIAWKVKDPSKGIYKEDFLSHITEFSRIIPNICNNDVNVWEDRFVCIQKIEDIIIQLREFFENISKKEYFRTKTTQKIQ